MHSSFIEPNHRLRARGVGFVEALLVIVVLTTLWLGVRSLTRLGRARLEVSASARHCAWQMARSGCTTQPPECATEETANTKGGEDSNLNAARQRTPKSSEGAVDRRVQAELDDLPGTRVRARVSRDVAGRLVRGGDRSTTAAHVSLPCAPRASPVGDLAPAVFDSLRGAGR